MIRIWRVGWWAQTTAGVAASDATGTPALLLLPILVGRLLVPGHPRIGCQVRAIGAPVLIIFLVRRKSTEAACDVSFLVGYRVPSRFWRLAASPLAYGVCSGAVLLRPGRLLPRCAGYDALRNITLS